MGGTNTDTARTIGATTRKGGGNNRESWGGPRSAVEEESEQGCSAKREAWPKSPLPIGGSEVVFLVLVVVITFYHLSYLYG